MSRPTLFAFAGLPSSGKSTLARLLTAEADAVCLRIDTIEIALRETNALVTGEEGYRVAYRLAADNLRLGRTVVADSVNPLRVTRAAWQTVADEANGRLMNIEIICSDPAEHRARLDARTAADPAHPPVTWADVCSREYEPWDVPPVVIDTAGRPVEICFADLKRAIVAWA